MRDHEHLPLAVRVLPATRPWPLHGVTGTRALESLWLKREPDGALMNRAGQAVARWISALAPHARHVWVACGPGGNGGDGLHAAAALARQGRQVSVSLHADPGTLSRDASQGLVAAREAGAKIGPGGPQGTVDVAIDALLGIGSRSEPRGAVLEGVMALGRCPSRRLAIDLPTGLDPETGVGSSHGQVTAEATLALLTLRPGLFTGSGRDVCGEIWFDSLGAEQDAIWIESAAARLTHAHEHPDVWVPRPHASHKGRFGDVHVVGGAPGMTGAARLAALAAMSSGAGRTMISLLDPEAPRQDAMHPEWIWRRLDDLQSPGLLESTTLVCGCGAGTALDELLTGYLARAARVVLDADALNAIARHPHLADAVRARGAAGQGSILTPHPLEAARLLGIDAQTVQSNRCIHAQRLSELFNATVVLKGSGSLIATPGQTMALNATGGPALASGGSGDVLAGWIGGLWAQADAATAGISPTVVAHAVACSAVWLHGSAADRYCDGGTLHPSELVESMRHERAPRRTLGHTGLALSVEHGFSGAPRPR